MKKMCITNWPQPRNQRPWWTVFRLLPGEEADRLCKGAGGKYVRPGDRACPLEELRRHRAARQGWDGRSLTPSFKGRNHMAASCMLSAALSARN